MMSPLNPSHFAFVATQTALRAGELLRKGFGTKYRISSKQGIQNLVTEYDKASEECIISSILSSFPDHSFLAEESGATRQNPSKVLWVIDPLDGTVNFAHNIPVFCVSIAATFGGETLCGVIYQPMTQELFIAEKGGGAYLNGVPLRVTTTARMEESMMATGFPYNVNENPLHCVDYFSEMTKHGIPIRRLGSAAIDLAYVAAGRFDAYWEVSLYPWDLAAGKLLVEEAGGRVTHYDGSPRDLLSEKTILATNGALHDQMIATLTPFLR